MTQLPPVHTGSQATPLLSIAGGEGQGRDRAELRGGFIANILFTESSNRLSTPLYTRGHFMERTAKMQDDHEAPLRLDPAVIE